MTIKLLCALAFLSVAQGCFKRPSRPPQATLTVAAKYQGTRAMLGSHTSFWVVAEGGWQVRMLPTDWVFIEIGDEFEGLWGRRNPDSRYWEWYEEKKHDDH